MMNPVFLFLEFNRRVDSFEIVNMNIIMKSVASFKFCF